MGGMFITESMFCELSQLFCESGSELGEVTRLWVAFVITRSEMYWNPSVVQQSWVFLQVATISFSSIELLCAKAFKIGHMAVCLQLVHWHSKVWSSAVGRNGTAAEVAERRTGILRPTGIKVCCPFRTNHVCGWHGLLHKLCCPCHLLNIDCP